MVNSKYASSPLCTAKVTSAGSEPVGAAPPTPLAAAGIDGGVIAGVMVMLFWEAEHVPTGQW